MARKSRQEESLEQIQCIDRSGGNERKSIHPLKEDSRTSFPKKKEMEVREKQLGRSAGRVRKVDEEISHRGVSE